MSMQSIHRRKVYILFDYNIVAGNMGLSSFVKRAVGEIPRKYL